MTRSKLVALTVLTASLAVVASLTVERPSRGDPGRKPPALVRQFVGAGSWRHRNEAARQAWQAQMKRFDDDSLSGRVVVVGSPLMDHAAVQGQVTGADVDGVLLDDDGRQVATFSGAIRGAGVSGTYTTADGDVGDWSWDGRLPN